MKQDIVESEWQGCKIAPIIAKLSARILNLAQMRRDRSVLLLLVSTAFAEVASNVVYVVLMEKAYQLGNGITAVGMVLVLQAMAQVACGSWMGGIADRWGFRKSAIMAALITIPLVFALAFAPSVPFIYLFASLFMAAKLLLTPARFGLVAQSREKSKLAEANMALMLVAGVGSFIGPAIAAALLLLEPDFNLPLLVAGAGWLFSVLPLTMIQAKAERPIAELRPSFLDEMRTGWHLIHKRITIGQVLTCLILAALFLGAVTPLFTPLSRELGLNSEGTGIFFSALGFGYLIGPLIATALFKRIRLSSALLIAGLLAPVGLVLIGILEDLGSVLIAVALVSTAGAGVNVIVTTVTQRLTPSEHRGSVLGMTQALIGLAWIVSLGTLTVITAIWDAESNIRSLFLLLGSVGFILILSCWLWNRRPILMACEPCEPRFRLSAIICWMMQGLPFDLSGAACGVICERRQ